MTTLVSVANGGIGLVVPADWETTLDGAPGIPVAAMAPPTPTPFRTNVVVTVGDVPAAMTSREWQAGTDLLLTESLEQYQLLDLEHVTVAGLEAVRRLAHHVTDEGIAVTMQQWAVLVEGHGVTLTATVPTVDFPVLARAVDAIGRSLSVDEGWPQ